MKKLMIIFAACCLVMTSCNHKAKETTSPEIQALQKMQEEKEKFMEDWNNWDNLTEEHKTELLNKRKESYDKITTDQKERAALKAKFEEQMANWDNLSIEERKLAFDLYNPKSEAAQAFLKQYRDSISRQGK